MCVCVCVGGGGGYGKWGKREIINLSLHCHHQNDSCIKMGSDESHFNVSLIVRNKVTRQCPQTTTSEEKGEPKRIRTDVPLLTSLTPYRRDKTAASGSLLQEIEFIGMVIVDGLGLTVFAIDRSWFVSSFAQV